MNHGECPKCKSNQIYRGCTADGQGLSSASYPAQIEISTLQGPVTFWIDTFICQDCGYVEMFVANAEECSRLSQADGWEKVNCDPGC
jgi:hypothetical protein